MLFTKLNTIGAMVEYICSHLDGFRQPQGDDDYEDVELSEFPATTMEEAQLLNEKLKKKAYSKKVVSIF